MKRSSLLLFLFVFILAGTTFGQSKPPFTHADTLRGFITPWRAWWNVTFYDLNVTVNPKDSTIKGWNAITYKVTGKAKDMQIDLQKPLHINKVVQDGKELKYTHDGNAWFIKMQSKQPIGSHMKITIYYSGHPHIAKRPPWSGGFSWNKDKKGRPWIETTAQAIGASIWWPNKDHLSDKTDSMSINITVPDPLVDVSNGRLTKKTHHSNGTTTYSWFVDNPINNYDVAIQIGHYKHFSGNYWGEKGKLDLNFWVQDYNLEKAKRYFPPQVHKMLSAYEYWFGPYPFYKDGYKLVDSHNTGMEHQSNIAYGNYYASGYRGRDVSGTGLGMKFDFIIVHESAHEWWGNSVTEKDLADMGIAESFANFAEGLYVDHTFEKKAGEEYIRGSRRNIRNKKPIIGKYG
jgi:aminopeptidase N